MKATLLFLTLIKTIERQELEFFCNAAHEDGENQWAIYPRIKSKILNVLRVMLQDKADASYRLYFKFIQQLETTGVFNGITSETSLVNNYLKEAEKEFHANN